jgi:hypothetical protein
MKSKKYLNRLWSNLLLVLLSLLLSYFLASAYFEDSEAKSTEMFFQNKSKDVGSIQVGGVQSYFYIYSNVGSNELKIDSIDARCGCLVPQTKPGLALPAGSVDSIEVHLNPIEKGFFRREIYVFSNSVSSPDLLVLTGRVE